MNSNELTFNELSTGEFVPNDWGHIDIFNYDYSEDEEVCFKLKVWSLQCKYAELVKCYLGYLSFGYPCGNMLTKMKIFKSGLEVLNRYDARDIDGDTTDYNVISYSTILNILNILNNKY
jgi:hypothetical protein